MWKLPFKIDWTKAKILKNLRIKLLHSNREQKITGLSNRACKEEKFLLRLKGSNNQNDKVQTVEITVYEYFVRKRGIELSYSSNLPCINVGSQCEPQFIPVELGGLNSLLSAEVSQTIPVVSKVPTLILAMCVTHAPSSLSDLPSIAAVVCSRQWPMISRYGASISTQPPKTETIHSLFRPVSDREDTGIIRELLMDFHASSGKRKPEQIIIVRQGLSESQFKNVISEMEEIIQACKFLDETWSPKFTPIVSQRRHHTKLFQSNSSDNIPPGTVVDTKICHPPYNNNFDMCAHAARVGTSRPIHYFVLLDEIGFSTDNVQELVHCLCYAGSNSLCSFGFSSDVRNYEDRGA